MSTLVNINKQFNLPLYFNNVNEISCETKKKIANNFYNGATVL